MYVINLCYNRHVGWRDGVFYYNKRLLKTIAENYCTIYDGLPVFLGTEIMNPFSLAEYRADFDIALKGIGRGHWTGQLMDYKYYHNYGKLQRIVIADILGISDSELERLGFWGISQLRGFAYYSMTRVLNNGGG